MSVLSDKQIRRLVEQSDASGQPLIDPFDEHALEGASYDMRLGPLMVVAGKPRVVALNVESHTLQPGDFVVLTTLERLQFPINIIGHNGIMSPWARSGLVSLFSPQIDPGFVGVLEVPVFNAGDAPIELIPGRRIFTVEFVRMSSAASYAWVDKHGPKNPPSDPLPPSALRPNLSDVQDLKSLQTALGSAFETLKLELAAERAEVDKRLTVIDAQLSALSDLDQRRSARQGMKWARLQVIWAVIAVLVAIAIYVIGLRVGGGQNTDTQPMVSTTTTAT